MRKSEILKLADEVSASLKTIGAAELERLAKAEQSEGSEKPEGSLGKASPSAEGSSPSASVPDASVSAEGSAPAGPPSESSAGGLPPSAPEAPPSPDAAPEAEGPSFEQLVELYSSLPEQDLEAHAAAIQQAMSAKAPSAAPAPSAGVGPAASPSASIAPPSSMGKAEEELLNRLSKAESDLKAVGEVVEKMLTIPQRKAVTGLSLPMVKTEQASKKPFNSLTKGELHEVLKKVTATPKLSKAERNLVNDYYLKPNSVSLADLEQIYNKV